MRAPSSSWSARVPRVTALSTGAHPCATTLSRPRRADRVGMEGAAIATSVATKNGVDCLVLRAISDNCDEAQTMRGLRACGDPDLMFKHSVEHDMISTAIEHLSAGETSYQVNLDDFDGKEYELAANINNISMGLETALQEKVKSERLKTDLITNVSHDIKTPLTSIINYVGLIRRENIQDEKILRYLDVLEQKANRLKTLTEDLVEASKASSGNLKLEISDINFTQLVYQTNGEFEEKFASRHLELITTAPEETLLIEADGRRLWRVLENLYNNAFKYAMESSRIYIDITKTDISVSEEGLLLPAQVVFTIKNVSANPLNIRGDELTERFVRGDVARTTEGSGLGLSIAKSLTELQNGRFEIYIDGDLFKVQLSFDVKKANL